MPGICFITGFGWASAGALISALMKSIDNFSYVTSTLITPMFLVAGTFFPISGLPRVGAGRRLVQPALPLRRARPRTPASASRAGSTSPTSAILLAFGLLMWRLAIWATGRRLID